MKHMSNEKPKRKVGRIAIVIVIAIVAIIAGAFAYQSVTSSSTSPPMQSTSQSMSATGSVTESQPVSILGAGATFPAPLIQKWTVEYHNLYSSVTINYNPIGSGGGIQQITKKTVDFGASDAPLSDCAIGKCHWPSINA